MADNIHGKRMSDYTPLSDLTQAEQATYLANAAVTTYGKTSVGGENTNVNVPLSAIKPDVPVTDVTVDGTSVLNAGVAEIPAIPEIPEFPNDAGDNSYVLGIKSGAFAWVKLDTTVYPSSSTAQICSVEYVSEEQ